MGHTVYTVSTHRESAYRGRWSRILNLVGPIEMITQAEWGRRQWVGLMFMEVKPSELRIGSLNTL